MAGADPTDVLAPLALVPGLELSAEIGRAGDRILLDGVVVGRIAPLGRRPATAETADLSLTLTLAGRELVATDPSGAERARIPRLRLRPSARGTVDGAPVVWRRRSLGSHYVLEDAHGGALVATRVRGAVTRRITVTVGPQGAAWSHVPLLAGVALALRGLRDDGDSSAAVA